MKETLPSPPIPSHHPIAFYLVANLAPPPPTCTLMYSSTSAGSASGSESEYRYSCMYSRAGGAHVIRGPMLRRGNTCTLGEVPSQQMR